MKLLTLLLLLSSVQCFTQFDTAHISQLVKGLHTIEDHKRFWKEMYYRDQHFRGKLANKSNDEENLVTVSYYFNRYGFPDTKKMGQESSIITAIWGHNRPDNVKKLTFPFIIESHKAKVMDELSFKQYWQGFYKQSFDDDNYKTKPLQEIFELLELNTTNRINIPELLVKMNEFNYLLNDPKVIIGQWKIPDTKKTNTINGKPFSYIIPGNNVQIFKHNDGKYYFLVLYNDKSGIPMELIPNSPLRFEIKNKLTPAIFQINENGDLISTNDSRSITFKKI